MLVSFYHRPSPEGGRGGAGKYNFLWGLKRSFYPAGGGNEGGLFFGSLEPRGKQWTS